MLGTPASPPSPLNHPCQRASPRPIVGRLLSTGGRDGSHERSLYGARPPWDALQLQPRKTWSLGCPFTVASPPAASPQRVPSPPQETLDDGLLPPERRPRPPRPPPLPPPPPRRRRRRVLPACSSPGPLAGRSSRPQLAPARPPDSEGGVRPAQARPAP